MATDNGQQQEPVATDDSEAEQAAFRDAFNDVAPAPPPAKEAEPATTAQDEPSVDEPAKAEEAAPTAPSPSPAPAVDHAAEMRKMHGRIGDLNSQLQTLMKTKEAEGKPAAMTSLELKRMQAEYPDMAAFLQEDLTEALAGLKQAAPDQKAVDTLVSERVQREIATLKESAVTDAHEAWKTDLWASGTPGNGDRTPEYSAWLGSMPPAEAQAFEDSSNPYQVIKGLNRFYDWKAKESKSKAEKQDRLAAAVTPQGVPRTGKSTMSDDDALRKGFAEGFNS